MTMASTLHAAERRRGGGGSSTARRWTRPSRTRSWPPPSLPPTFSISSMVDHGLMGERSAAQDDMIECCSMPSLRIIIGISEFCVMFFQCD
uniref:Uncharacterized protein n=1 Tax=Oryza brachyantha TaxID=4533 RepID=J3M4I5_ORYBR